VSTIETVGGPIDGAELGVTLLHEHLFLRDLEIDENYPQEFLWDEQELVARARAGLTELKALGVDTIVDVTVLGIGRSIPLIQRVADGLDINIVVATGAFYPKELPPYLMTGGAPDAAGSLERMFLADIREGIAGTAVRAAVIKVATDVDGMLPGPERVLRAAAHVHLQTDVPITTHTHAASHGGRAQQQVLAEEGVNLERVVIGHCGDTTDLDYLKELMDNGSCIGMDRFGVDSFLPQEERIETVVTLCEQGYADRMILSHDASYFLFGLDPERRAEVLPNLRHTLLSEVVLDELLSRGVADRQIRQMMVDNPCRILSRGGNQP
jgi:phosphotriesterase-related protein